MASDTGGQKIYIGMGTCGLATGAEGVLTAVHEGFDKLTDGLVIRQILEPHRA